MSAIRVLVVDDSVVARSLIVRGLKGEPDIEVVAALANGREAVEHVGELKPDVLTLDVEMPDMDGLEVLAELRRRGVRLPTIMFSSLTENGAATTLKALFNGAQDYLLKPSTKSQDEAVNYIRSELVPRIRMLHKRLSRGAPVKPGAAERAPPAAAPKVNRAGKDLAEVVAIGASVGGPAALAALLPTLREANLPVLMVQHMPPLFTRQLAEQLREVAGFSVVEAADGDEVCAGHGYLAPGDHHMEVTKIGERMTVRLNRQPHENYVRPAADVLFRSVAAVYRGKSLGVILTGAGKDGLVGCQAIRAAGGQVLIQDEASSIVWGMPGAVSKAGATDDTLPLSELGAAILTRCHRQGRSS